MHIEGGVRRHVKQECSIVMSWTQVGEVVLYGIFPHKNSRGLSKEEDAQLGTILGFDDVQQTLVV